MDGIGFPAFDLAPFTQYASYLSAAQALMPAVHVLATTPAGGAMGLVLVSGHTLESALKAFLTYKLGSNATLTNTHNIEKLWAQAASMGLPVDSDPPPWVVELAKVFCSPFLARYGNMEHIISTPAPAPGPMAASLATLLRVVQSNMPVA